MTILATSPILSVKGIDMSFSGRQILEDVSFNLYDKEIVCLLGLSGCGKSTLFNIIAGLLSPDRGSVNLNGKNITGETGNFSYMLQKDMLLPWFTMLDNAALPLRLKGIGKGESRKRATSFFSAFGLAGFEKSYPFQCSGGMRQRLALSRAYLFAGQVMLLDEPFSALDAITKNQMQQWYLDVMQKINVPTVFISHDIDEALLLSDRICLLTGSPAHISCEIKIDAERPRKKDFALSSEFIEYKRRILGLLASHDIHL